MTLPLFNRLSVISMCLFTIRIFCSCFFLLPSGVTCGLCCLLSVVDVWSIWLQAYSSTGKGTIVVSCVCMSVGYTSSVSGNFLTTVLNILKKGNLRFMWVWCGHSDSDTWKSSILFGDICCQTSTLKSICIWILLTDLSSIERKAAGLQETEWWQRWDWRCSRCTGIHW